MYMTERKYAACEVVNLQPDLANEGATPCIVVDAGL